MEKRTLAYILKPEFLTVVRDASKSKVWKKTDEANCKKDCTWSCRFMLSAECLSTRQACFQSQYFDIVMNLVRHESLCVQYYFFFLKKKEVFFLTYSICCTAFVSFFYLKYFSLPFWGWQDLMFLKEASYAHQGCIYLIKNSLKKWVTYKTCHLFLWLQCLQSSWHNPLNILIHWFLIINAGNNCGAWYFSGKLDKFFARFSAEQNVSKNSIDWTAMQCSTALNTHAHTALTQPICYHWTPYNAHPRHCIWIICCTFAHLSAAQPICC